MPLTIQQMVDRWTSAERPLFKGALISDDGCCCAQGDVLRVCGFTDDSLRSMNQRKADQQVAKELGISTLQAVLLRKINDRQDGCPQLVLANPGLFFGPNADLILEFGRHIDAMEYAAWAAVGAASGAVACNAAWAAACDAAGAVAWAASGAVAGGAAWAAACDAAWAAAGAVAGDAAWAAAWSSAWSAAGAVAVDAAWAAAWSAAWAVAGAVAGDAAWEMCGWTKLAGKPFFLPIIGITDPVEFVENIRPEANREREAFIESLKNK